MRKSAVLCRLGRGCRTILSQNPGIAWMGEEVWPLPRFFWRICPHALRALKCGHLSPKSDISLQKCSLFPRKDHSMPGFWERIGRKPLPKTWRAISSRKNFLHQRSASQFQIGLLMLYKFEWKMYTLSRKFYETMLWDSNKINFEPICMILNWLKWQ